MKNIICIVSYIIYIRKLFLIEKPCDNLLKHGISHHTTDIKNYRRTHYKECRDEGGAWTWANQIQLMLPSKLSTGKF
uniref:Uncharacterized protein n=1 Tax=Aegilops tauschii subsp. strangulata TaxID=200361 RepID=A0A453I4A5_AEGTS